MDPGPLVPASGQSLRELQAAVPIELNRPLVPGIIPCCPRRTPYCANIFAS
jgi:hypothetical protein